jgi:hypothetical protein
MTDSDYGTPVHYTAIERGTAVYDVDGIAVGVVRRVQDNFKEHILDGFEIADNDGTVRFVDAPEVSRTFERAVTLSITAAQLPELATPVESRLPLPEVKPGGFLSRLFNRG